MYRKKFFFSIPVLLLFACSKQGYIHTEVYDFRSEDKKPDYSKLEYWAAHPWKWDPSDSVPAPLRKNYIGDSTVDVFFVHPTTLFGKNEERWNAPIDDAAINKKTDYSTILYQASVFNEQCRVFAPRYRQANLNAFFTIKKDTAARAFELAYTDVREAFEYYLEHYNGGRPIIIAAHSQGTVHAARLLREYFEGKKLYNKLVCAYLIGMPVRDDYFNQLLPCKDSLNTTCFCSWRSFKKGYTEPVYVANETFKAVVTNPLTWRTDETAAPRKLNQGGILKNFNKLSKRVVSAQVHGNVLWTSKPRFFGNFLLRTKNYHIGDINLFYMNMREDVKRRVGFYWKQ
ncbi:MAG: DUF3089 domain-containing protein [Ferruginibacter sp.]